MSKLPRSVSKRSRCPVATTLDILGDRWTLLIIRDIALFNKHKNKEFQQAGESIPTNILANRLKLLLEVGLIEKRLYQDNPPRYEYHLTREGERLLPVIQSIARWAQENIEGIEMPHRISMR